MEQVDFQDSKDGLAHRYKCVIINEANSLTRDAQAALRRTMEKYSKNIRLILVCDSMSSIISPIRSRCLLLRCPAPSNEETIKILSEVAVSENLTLESGSILNKIARESNNNLRTALLMLESMALNNELQLKVSTPVIKPDWKVVIAKMSTKIQRERNVGALLECRSVLYDLLSHCIPAKVILEELLNSLLDGKNLPDKTKSGIIECSSTFDERLALGNKAIYHLEGFIARVMCIIDGQ